MQPQQKLKEPTLEKTTFEKMLDHPSRLVDIIHRFERSCDINSDERVSPIVGTADGIKWYRVRRMVCFLVWDIYTASAIAHYRRTHQEANTPLLKKTGVCGGVLPPDLAERLEKAYYASKVVPWKDERPDGYSYHPFDDGYYQFHETITNHRLMAPEVGPLITEALTLISPQIEKIMGHHWVAGSARLFESLSQKGGDVYHSDQWPLGLKKIMIYPSGAGVERGATEFILPDGSLQIVDGGKGVWALFENTLIQHRAKAGTINEPRPTIEVAIIPSLYTDPTLPDAKIHVGFPWLPSDFSSLVGGTCPTSFTADEVMNRTLARMLMLAQMLPDKPEIPKALKGLGVYD